ncbi:MAG: hypothetical protein WCK67_00925 [bacterium]
MPKTLSTVINIPNILGFYSAITFCLLYHLYSHFCRKKALQIINNSLEQDEVIIFEPKFSWLFNFLAPLSFGGYVGVYNLPFFIYKGINEVDIVNRQNLYFFVVVSFLSLIFFLFLGCLKTVLTNKKIIFCFPFKFFKTQKNILVTPYTDIKTIELPKKVYGSAHLIYLTFKDGSNKKIFSGIKDLEKIKLIIENHINQ